MADKAVNPRDETERVIAHAYRCAVDRRDPLRLPNDAWQADTFEVERRSIERREQEERKAA